MTNEEAVKILRRIQDPEAWEPQITRAAFEALDMAIEALGRQQAAGSKDLISRQSLLEKYDEQHEGPPGRARKLIEEELPVHTEIIHCKDCGHRDDHGCCKYWKALAIGDIPIATDDNDFCSHAERRNDVFVER